MIVEQLIELLKQEHPKAKVHISVEYGRGCYEKCKDPSLTTDGKGKKTVVTLWGDSDENDSGEVE